MGNYTEYSYVAYLRDNAPSDVLDNLVLSFENNSVPYGAEHVFNGKMEFLNKIRVDYFCKDSRLIVVVGVSKYYRDKEQIKKFVEWIDQFVSCGSHSYRGLIYYDTGDSAPDLIYGNKIITVQESIEIHDR